MTARSLQYPAQETISTPPHDANFSSSREILRLKREQDGTLQADTSGGTLRFAKGLWSRSGAPPITAAKNELPSWRGQTIRLDMDGLLIHEGKTVRRVALPESSGTHISAVLARGNRLWAALFGDGIWEWDGQRWHKPNLKLPDAAREITSLAQSGDGKTVWLGTRRQGVWSYAGGAWKQYLQPDEPFAHNVQFLQSFRNALWASTLEDGLVVRDAKGWTHFGSGVLSSNAPRQMAVFRNKLYVRHSSEVVDCFDGHKWIKNVFPNLPRKQIIALAADAKHLYLGQWGGWSEWDGTAFSHHLKIPELQIVPLLQIFSDTKADKLWLGTENRGLFEWNIATQRLRLHDERNGLPDDWITSLNRNGSTLYAGTFSGGLAWRADSRDRWQSAPELKRTGITAIVVDGAKRTLIATRFGLYVRDAQGNLSSCNTWFAPREREIQALLLTPAGLWIGTRNGLLFRTHRTLDRMAAGGPV